MWVQTSRTEDAAKSTSQSASIESIVIESRRLEMMRYSRAFLFLWPMRLKKKKRASRSVLNIERPSSIHIFCADGSQILISLNLFVTPPQVGEDTQSSAVDRQDSVPCHIPKHALLDHDAR